MESIASHNNSRGTHCISTQINVVSVHTLPSRARGDKVLVCPHSRDLRGEDTWTLRHPWRAPCLPKEHTHPLSATKLAQRCWQAGQFEWVPGEKCPSPVWLSMRLDNESTREVNKRVSTVSVPALWRGDFHAYYNGQQYQGNWRAWSSVSVSIIRSRYGLLVEFLSSAYPTIICEPLVRNCQKSKRLISTAAIFLGDLGTMASVL